MYHCYQLLPSTVIKVGYKITILNNIINIFILFFSNLIGRVNKKIEFFDWFYVNATSQRLVITLVLVGYSTGSTYSLEYQSNLSRKTISFLMICLIPKSFLGSVLAPGIPNDACTLFWSCVIELDWNKENIIINNKYRNDWTITVIIAIYSTYLFKWCTTIPNF